MLKKVKIGTKMLGGFGVVVLLAALLGGLAIIRMNNVGEQVSRLSAADVPSVSYANEVELKTLQAMVDDTAYSFTGETQYSREAAKHFAKAIDALKQSEKLAEAQNMKNRAAALAECRVQAEHYQQFTQQAHQAFGQLADIRAAMDQAAARFVKNCDEFLAEQNAKMTRDVDERRKKIDLVASIMQLGNDTRVRNFRAQAMQDPALMQAAIEQMATLKKYADPLRQITRMQIDIDQINTIEAAAQDYTTAMDAYLRAVAAKNATALAKARTQMDAAAGRYMQSCQQFLDSQNKQLDQDVAERLMKIGMVTEVVELCNNARIRNFQSQATRSSKTMQQGLDLFPVVNQTLDELRKIVRDPEDLNRIANTRTAADSYRDAMQSYLRKWQQLEQIDEQRLATGAQLLDLVSKTAKTGMTNTMETAKNADDSLAAASMIVLGGLVVVVFIGIGAALIITRIITKPIKNVVNMLQDIAQGEGDLTRRIEVHSEDEIGQLAKWFNIFVQKIHDTVKQVSTATQDVASAATQIAGTSAKMSSGLMEQSQQTTQVSSAVEEMSSSIVEVARKSADAAGNAEAAGKQAQQGGEVVTQTVDGINRIAQVVSESASAITELGRRSEQIGQVIDVINDIADQTNLLALNAAIEAARAGEHGRGFAVVADEVRKLADRTTKATEEIGDSIKAIQDETRGAVHRMEAGTKEVDTGVELAKQAGESLQSIVTAARQVSSMIQAIAAAAEEQSAASEQISRSVESITAVTRESSAGAEQSSAAAQQLSRRTEQLQGLVGQFKLAGE